MKKSFLIKNEYDMRDLAAKLAEASFAGVFIALFGGLGAGKTAFVKGFCAYFGIAEVSSPTFNIVKHYNGGEAAIDHFDCYRLDDADELLAMGFDEYLFSNSIILMEWSENVPDALPAERLEIHIGGSGNDVREVELVPFGKKYEAMIEELAL
ncbi:MAG: tRNA (adenosine(37)-N6)-threonylcarbamoyltransferase complex ATPase subunit type 1 TsaE [Clostridia bacterium]|nr:tRNA (adenosine(37)-N6)-threonylcarbamoyltransferase complex ATPase subunit type 1 TsaE [Clostridia bacterium]